MADKKVQIKNTGGDSLFPRATLDNIGANMTSNTTMIASGGKILNNYLPSATSAAAGTVQLATDAETSSGIATGKAVTPAGMKNAMMWTEIQDMGTSDIGVNPGEVYRGTCLEGSRTISANVTSESMYGADAHVEMYLDEGASVKTTGDLLLMDPLTDGAGNNCVVKFRGGKAYMYKESTDVGYVVNPSVTGSATSGSLAYGVVNGKRWIVLPNTVTSQSITVGSTRYPESVPNHINIIGKSLGDATYKPRLSLYCNLESGSITLRDTYLTSGVFSLASSNSVPKSVEFAGNCDITSAFTFTHGGIARVLPGGSLKGFTAATEINFSNTYGNSNSFCCSNGSLQDIKFTNLDKVSGKSYFNGPVVRAYGGGSASLKNVKLVSCNAQLAAAYSSGTAIIKDCLVASSTVLGSGGIVTCGCSGAGGQATVEMSNCVISGTTATSGALLKAVVEQGQFVTTFGDGLKMVDCTITSNTMPYENNYVVYASRGGAMSGKKPYLNMSNCQITGNTCYHGGALTIIGGAHETIRECNIVDNVASSGGAIFASGGYSYPTNFVSCTISGNTATVGGLAYLQDAKVGFTDCRLGGTVFLDGPNGPGITLAGSNVLDIECQYASSTTKYGNFRISAGAIIDLSQCENHTSNILYSQWPDGIKVGRINPLIDSHWIQEGSATVIPYGGGSAVTISGAFSKLNRNGTTA